jgi:hypothetical protein
MFIRNHYFAILDVVSGRHFNEEENNQKLQKREF